jgi:hypothetical protein
MRPRVARHHWLSDPNVPVAEREAVIEPDSVPDDGHWETVAVGFRFSHDRSAYPTLIKATQPMRFKGPCSRAEGFSIPLQFITVP